MLASRAPTSIYYNMLHNNNIARARARVHARILVDTGLRPPQAAPPNVVVHSCNLSLELRGDTPPPRAPPAVSVLQSAGYSLELRPTIWPSATKRGKARRLRRPVVRHSAAPAVGGAQSGRCAPVGIRRERLIFAHQKRSPDVRAPCAQSVMYAISPTLCHAIGSSSSSSSNSSMYAGQVYHPVS